MMFIVTGGFVVIKDPLISMSSYLPCYNYSIPTSLPPSYLLPKLNSDDGIKVYQDNQSICRSHSLSSVLNVLGVGH